MNKVWDWIRIKSLNYQLQIWGQSSENNQDK
jgi:hypothetical protein